MEKYLFRDYLMIPYYGEKNGKILFRDYPMILYYGEKNGKISILVLADDTLL